MSAPVRVLVTRPQPEADRTAAALVARGHRPLLLRLLEVRPTPQPMPEGPFAACLATSAQAFASLTVAMPGFPVRLRAGPVFVVGAQTAAVARAAAFTDVREGPGDAAGLAGAIIAAAPGLPAGPLLYLAGEPHKPWLATRLHEAGLRVVVLRLYAVGRVAGAGEALADVLGGEAPPDAVLHFSRASAEALADAARTVPAALRARLAGCLHVCLSADVAMGLRGLGPVQSAIAATPDTNALLDALDFRLRTPQIGLRGSDRQGDATERPVPAEPWAAGRPGRWNGDEGDA